MRRREAGFSLAEMMVVVAIMSVLSTVAYFSLTKYIDRAHAAEVPRMFGEFKTKEEAYHAEFGQYLSTGDEGVYYPLTIIDGKTTISSGATGTVPATWNSLRINAGEKYLYCQYASVAGVGGSTAGMGTIGLSLWSGVAPLQNWFYLMAQCDWQSSSEGYSQYYQRGDLTTLYKENEGS